jgi:hypothetical protein
MLNMHRTECYAKYASLCDSRVDSRNMTPGAPEYGWTCPAHRS